MSQPEISQGFAGRVFNTGGRWVSINASGVTTTGDTATGGGSGDTLDVFSGGGSLVTDTTGGNSITNIDYPKALADRFKKWKERVANYSPWNDVFSVSQQESNLVIDVPFENRYWFTVYAIGFSWVEGTRLKRINPIQHPYYPWMNCSRAGSQGVRFEGAKAFFSSEVANSAAVSSGVAKYKLARFNLGFTNYPWRFAEDSEIVNDYDESSRNTYFEMQPTAQMLAAEGGAATLGYPQGPGAQSQFRAPFGTVVGQIKFTLHWKWVPWDYVLKGYLPVNLTAGVYTVNDATWFTDFAKGTMLYDPPHITTYVAPLRPFSTPAFYCDIALPLTYFDPLNGLSNPTAGYDRRGHNLMPFRDRPGVFYPATRKPTGSSTYPDPSDTNMLFAYSDFRKIFQKPV